MSLQKELFTLNFNKLRTDSAGGPDMLSPSYLNKVSGFIASPLAFMFEEFFRNSFVPPVWRTAFIRPIIFKSGDSLSVNNYRPISLTCTCSKIMESIDYLID